MGQKASNEVPNQVVERCESGDENDEKMFEIIKQQKDKKRKTNEEIATTVSNSHTPDSSLCSDSDSTIGSIGDLICYSPDHSIA